MYNKLFTQILDSSIWLETHPTRIVWMTLIASMDEKGYAHFAAVENLANRARVTPQEAKEAVRCLESPDKNSGDPSHDGRRIERVPGGWVVLNAKKYRSTVTRSIQQEQTRLRVSRYRQRKKSDALQSNAEPADDTGHLRVKPSEVCNAQSNAIVTPSDTDTNTKTTRALVESFEKKASRKLAEIIEKEYSIRKDTRAWPRVFVNMQRFQNISAERIRRAINWYGKHIGEMFTPHIEDAKEFRAKFGKLEKQIDKEKPVTHETELDTDAKEALRQIESSDLTWPHGSKQALPQLVAASMAGAKAFCERRAALVALWRENRPDERRALINFDENIGSYVFASETGGLPRFVAKWAAHVNAIIQSWSEWRGQLSYFHFTSTHKDFRKMIIETGTPDAHLLVDEYLRRMNK